MQIEINEEESVIIHNAVIFMANDLMEEIVEIENSIEDNPEAAEKYNYKDELEEKKRRWQAMVDLTNKVKG